MLHLYWKIVIKECRIWKIKVGMKFHIDWQEVTCRRWTVVHSELTSSASQSIFTWSIDKSTSYSVSELSNWMIMGLNLRLHNSSVSRNCEKWCIYRVLNKSMMIYWKKSRSSQFYWSNISIMKPNDPTWFISMVYVATMFLIINDDNRRIIHQSLLDCSSAFVFWCWKRYCLLTWEMTKRGLCRKIR